MSATQGGVGGAISATRKKEEGQEGGARGARKRAEGEGGGRSGTGQELVSPLTVPRSGAGVERRGGREGGEMDGFESSIRVRKRLRSGGGRGSESSDEESGCGDEEGAIVPAAAPAGDSFVNGRRERGREREVRGVGEDVDGEGVGEGIDSLALLGRGVAAAEAGGRGPDKR